MTLSSPQYRIYCKEFRSKSRKTCSSYTKIASINIMWMYWSVTNVIHGNIYSNRLSLNMISTNKLLMRHSGTIHLRLYVLCCGYIQWRVSCTNSWMQPHVITIHHMSIHLDLCVKHYCIFCLVQNDPDIETAHLYVQINTMIFTEALVYQMKSYNNTKIS